MATVRAPIYIYFESHTNHSCSHTFRKSSLLVSRLYLSLVKVGRGRLRMPSELQITHCIYAWTPVEPSIFIIIPMTIQYNSIRCHLLYGMFYYMPIGVSS